MVSPEEIHQGGRCPTCGRGGPDPMYPQLKGYEGEACGTCGQFTLVRFGVCTKCDSCGATSGEKKE